jgi:hypothetical protein
MSEQEWVTSISSPAQLAAQIPTQRSKAPKEETMTMSTLQVTVITVGSWPAGRLPSATDPPHCGW